MGCVRGFYFTGTLIFRTLYTLNFFVKIALSYTDEVCVRVEGSNDMRTQESTSRY